MATTIIPNIDEIHDKAEKEVDKLNKEKAKIIKKDLYNAKNKHEAIQKIEINYNVNDYLKLDDDIKQEQAKKNAIYQSVKDDKINPFLEALIYAYFLRRSKTTELIQYENNIIKNDIINKINNDYITKGKLTIETIEAIENKILNSYKNIVNTVVNINQSDYWDYLEKNTYEKEIFYYKYVGPLDEKTRPFCRRVLNKIKTKKQWQNMLNDFNQNVWQYLGGYNCRHNLIMIDSPKKTIKIFNPNKAGKDWKEASEYWKKGKGSFRALYSGKYEYIKDIETVKKHNETFEKYLNKYKGNVDIVYKGEHFSSEKALLNRIKQIEKNGNIINLDSGSIDKNIAEQFANKGEWKLLIIHKGKNIGYELAKTGKSWDKEKEHLIPAGISYKVKEKAKRGRKYIIELELLND